MNGKVSLFMGIIPEVLRKSIVRRLPVADDTKDSTKQKPALEGCGGIAWRMP